jgi:uncharacterized damage-inducible protein DinB
MDPMTQALLGEFKQEAESTRKLLQAIPDTALNYKPSELSWTTAQLASHIAEIYNWYEYTLSQPVFDMSAYRYDKGDITKMSTILGKFEENQARAEAALQAATPEQMAEIWRMTVGGKDAFPPMPRSVVMRGFLFNHLYHHRGEMIVYLRATGNKVPGMYGPVAEDFRK